MAEGLGNGGYAQPKHTGRNIAIGTGIALGAAALTVGIVSLVKNSNLSEQIATMRRDNQATVEKIDSRMAAQQKSDSLKFVVVDSTLGTLDAKTGKLTLTTNALGGRIGTLENRANMVDATLASVNLTLDGLLGQVKELAKTDASLKQEVDKVCSDASANQAGILKLVDYLKVRDMVGAHKKQIGYDDFTRISGKLSGTGTEPTPSAVYGEWCKENKQKPKF